MFLGACINKAIIWTLDFDPLASSSLHFPMVMLCSISTVEPFQVHCVARCFSMCFSCVFTLKNRGTRHTATWWLSRLCPCSLRHFNGIEKAEGGTKGEEDMETGWGRVKLPPRRHLLKQIHPRSLTASLRPQKWWVGTDPFQLGPGNFSGVMLNLGRVLIIPFQQ